MSPRVTVDGRFEQAAPFVKEQLQRILDLKRILWDVGSNVVSTTQGLDCLPWIVIEDVQVEYKDFLARITP